MGSNTELPQSSSGSGVRCTSGTTSRPPSTSRIAGSPRRQSTRTADSQRKKSRSRRIARSPSEIRDRDTTR